MAKNQAKQTPSPPFPARSCWSAPARWAAPCSTAGSPASCRRKDHRAGAAAVEGDQGAGQARRAHQSQGRCRRGRRAGDRGEAADRAGRAAAARGADRCQDRGGLDHGRAHASAFSKSICRTPRSCAPCRTRRPPSAAASPSRSATAASTRKARKLAHGLLAATGSVEWVDDEALMDAVTAVSGSGPAYVFLLAEAMAQAGAAAGLPAALAEKLARETVAGSGELLHRSPRACRDLAPERDLARRHHRRGARGADGRRRRRAADDQGGRRRDQAWQRFGGLKFSALERPR